jgi:protein-disulfide isomerase|tara:strand:+ start:1064 stop:1645 length:582 start_codon:yes stop_codon:yes gene_type:complete
MKKILFTLIIFLLSHANLGAENNVKRIYEGKEDSKITILVYESLTCSHCAKFHSDVYPDLKKNFIDNGYVKLEYRNFPLDLAAFNAAKAAHCKSSNGEEILHFLYKNQNEWVKGNTIEELNTNLEKILKTKNFGIDYNKCINNKKIEDFVLEDRIEGVKKYNVNATPTLIINGEKFEKSLTYKNLEKTLEKLL